MTSDEIIGKFKNLRTELMHWLINNDTRNLLVNNLQYGIKTALNLTHAIIILLMLSTSVRLMNHWKQLLARKHWPRELKILKRKM